METEDTIQPLRHLSDLYRAAPSDPFTFDGGDRLYDWEKPMGLLVDSHVFCLACAREFAGNEVVDKRIADTYVFGFDRESTQVDLVVDPDVGSCEVCGQTMGSPLEVEERENPVGLMVQAAPYCREHAHLGTDADMAQTLLTPKYGGDLRVHDRQGRVVGVIYSLNPIADLSTCTVCGQQLYDSEPERKKHLDEYRRYMEQDKQQDSTAE